MSAPVRILLELLAGVLVALLLRHYVCVIAYVKGSSMRDTLRNGEVVFALRRNLCRELRRFDVVLCRYPGRRELFVKRIVALPGERIALDEGAPVIDGAALEEHFPLRRGRRTMEERTMGEKEYFVMGDNRPCSRDSRAVGPIEEREILAVVCCVLFPPTRIRRIRT